MVEIAVLIVFLAIIITTHEFMHGYVANYLGDDTARLSGRLTLNPIKHIDLFGTILLPLMLYFAGLTPFGAAKPVPFNPSRLRNGETGLAMVALAGPFTNLALAALAGLWTQIVSVPPDIYEYFLWFGAINVGFFVFNLIPFPPLDGSRLLYVLAPESVRGVMRQIESAGLFGIGIFIFIGFPFIAPIMRRAIMVIVSFLFPEAGSVLNP